MSVDQEWFGSIEIDDESPIVAGSYITRVLTFTVGKYGMDNGGRIRLLFRLASDTSIPQMSDPKADNYMVAYSSNTKAVIKGRYSPKGGYRPWMQSYEFEVGSESLDEGEKIFIVIGDKTHGSRGYRAQTFVESNFQWKVEVENFETGVFMPLSPVPISSIISGQPEKAVLLGPSFCESGEAISSNIKIEDKFGNPSPYEGEITFTLEEIDEYGTVKNSHHLSDVYHTLEKGVAKTDSFQIDAEGYYQVAATVKGLAEERVVSNPIIVGNIPNGNKHYWGDFHAQYNNSTGIGSVEDAFTYARDAAAVSFVGHQPNDFLLTEEGWQEAKEAVEKYHEPGSFIPILGYEWSGNTPKGGDRNVHYLNNDGPLHRTSHWQVPDKSDIGMDKYDLKALYESLENRNDVIVVPHVGGRRCDITNYFNEKLEPVIEVCSTHGRFQWLLEEALDNNYVVGVVGGSDDHTGRPGLSYPTNHHFGTRGGLAGVYMEQLDRESIFNAVKKRHTYATTGERIALEVSTNDGHFMGDYWEASSAPKIQVKTAGTKPLESIELYRNKEMVYSYPIYKSEPLLNKIRIEWGGARVKGRTRHTVWDGSVTVENGMIQNAECFAFDHPDQGITKQSDHHVDWVSSTSGDHDGIILTIDGDKDTRITFTTPHGMENVTLGEIFQNPIHRDCGAVNQYYKITSYYEETGPQIVQFDWEDSCPQADRNAYWVKVTQKDGEIAWSSPLYFMKV